MNDKVKIITTAVIVLVIGLGAFFLFNYVMGNRNGNIAPSTSTNQNSVAPDFKVTDEKGNDISLSDFKGKPVVVNFATSWCGYCKKEFPDFAKAYKKYGDKVQFMIVDVVGASGETKEDFIDYVTSEKLTFPYFFDVYSEASQAYGVNSFPQTFFISSDGKISDLRYGATNYTELEHYIENLLGE